MEEEYSQKNGGRTDPGIKKKKVVRLVIDDEKSQLSTLPKHHPKINLEGMFNADNRSSGF